MAKRIICLGVMLVMFFSLAGCGEKFELDRVSVMIKAEFQQKFESEEFIVQDFEWENIEGISYIAWYEKSSSGSMIVHLKKHGKKHVLDAVEHFKTLGFVKSAEPVYNVSLIKPVK